MSLSIFKQSVPLGVYITLNAGNTYQRNPPLSPLGSVYFDNPDLIQHVVRSNVVWVRYRASKPLSGIYLDGKLFPLTFSRLETYASQQYNVYRFQGSTGFQDGTLPSIRINPVLTNGVLVYDNSYIPFTFSTTSATQFDVSSPSSILPDMRRLRYYTTSPFGIRPQGQHYLFEFKDSIGLISRIIVNGVSLTATSVNTLTVGAEVYRQYITETAPVGQGRISEILLKQIRFVKSDNTTIKQVIQPIEQSPKHISIGSLQVKKLVLGGAGGTFSNYQGVDHLNGSYSYSILPDNEYGRLVIDNGLPIAQVSATNTTLLIDVLDSYSDYTNISEFKINGFNLSFTKESADRTSIGLRFRRYSHAGNYANALLRGTGMKIEILDSSNNPVRFDKSKTLWENTNPPTINYFTVSPTSIDRDTRTVGNIQLGFSVANATACHIVREPQGDKVGVDYAGQISTPIVQAFTTPQPTAPQTYRLIAQNSGGSVHQDVSVDVTLNPQVSAVSYQVNQSTSNLITRYAYVISATIKGLPRPTVSINQGIGQLTDRHLEQTAPDTWTLTGVQHTSSTPLTGSFIVTATNSSGSTSGSAVIT